MRVGASSCAPTDAGMMAAANKVRMWRMRENAMDQSFRGDGAGACGPSESRGAAGTWETATAGSAVGLDTAASKRRSKRSATSRQLGRPDSLTTAAPSDAGAVGSPSAS